VPLPFFMKFLHNPPSTLRREAICVFLLGLFLPSMVAATTIYSEDFSNPLKLGNIGANAELGNGGDYVMGTWVYSSGNAGIDDAATGDGSGTNLNNLISTVGEARPQSGRGTNSRAICVILDGSQFAEGVPYSVSFDVIGDPAGANSGRYWLALISGYDAGNGIRIDGTHNGWGAAAGTPKPFAPSGSGNATINYLADSATNGVPIDGENSAGTVRIEFFFTHDGSSDVGLAFGTYNNIYAIDNLVITDPNEGNVLPEVSVESWLRKYTEIDEGSTQTLALSASDSDGSISRLAVRIDNVLVDERTLTDSFTLENAFAGLAPGTHELEVIATDNLGGVATEAISFYIVPAVGELVGQFPYATGLSQVAGYLRYVPPGFNANPDRQWPLLVWLHGAGNRGDDPLQLRGAGGPPSRIQNGDVSLEEFVVFSPQVIGSWADEVAQDELDALVDEHVARFRIDPERIIITGQSMGGRGTYTTLARHPEKYAVAAPICGWTDISTVASFAHVPIWIFHGDLDPTIPYQASVDINAALLAAGALNLQFHTIVGGGHDVWTETYQRDDLYEWMLHMSWLRKYYGTDQVLEPLLDQDTDGDGQDARTEYETGTSPIDPTSAFRMLAPLFGGAELTLSWTSEPGQLYTIDKSATLTDDWLPLQPESISADPSKINSFQYSVGDFPAFFRVRTQR
jgi:predicted esterase